MTRVLGLIPRFDQDLRVIAGGSVRPFLSAALVGYAALLPILPASAVAPKFDAAYEPKSRVIVLTDIGNEPDDAESMVRFLLYSNEFDVEGLVATTSTHQSAETRRELIDERIAAYGEVLPNLRKHADGYPDARELARVVRSGSSALGMSGVGDGKDTEASRLIIAAVDRPDPRPVWITIWGGAADLAQALWTVRATRTPAEVDHFVAKLRVYSISDQDDAGPWSRMSFPKLFWITSLHGYLEYGLSTWSGISAVKPGADQSMVSKEWLDKNVHAKGPLGALYPLPMYIMEGDTPSFLHLIPNGLSVPDHPDWGGWGGRYRTIAPFLGVWASVGDTVIGLDGKPQYDQAATVWRWRSAFQNDFAARMDWSITPTYSAANHPPRLVLNGKGGTQPVQISICPGDTINLSAKGSRDPDGTALEIRWWIYGEAAQMAPVRASLSQDVGEATIVKISADLPKQHNGGVTTPFQAHVILEVSDKGTPPLTRYRRAVLQVRDDCPAPKSQAEVRPQ